MDSFGTYLHEAAGAQSRSRAAALAPYRFPFWKRAMDICVAVCGIVLSAPVLLACALAVRWTSPGPALHWSRRVGRDNRIFPMPKFRTMRTNTPQLPTHLLNDAGAYITPVGRLLRKTSLDELPQLISVLRGQVSLVGPRPALFNQDDLIALRTEQGVHRMLPGITGWAQVNGRDELSVPDKVRYDYEYMNRHSLAFDLKILCMTVLKVARRDGIQH